MPLTEWTDLLARLERDPESEVLACMLIDELMEARGMAKNEATRYVEHARTDARLVLDMTFVTRVIKEKGPAHSWLMCEVFRQLGLHPHEPVTIFVVAGEGRPARAVPTEHVPGAQVFIGVPVSLPATWARRVIKSSGQPIMKAKPIAPAHGWIRKGGKHAPS